MGNIERKKSSDYIAEQLAVEILSGKMRGNTPLHQEELAEILEVSRNPIREALRILELQGLAIRLVTRHTITVDFTENKVVELYGMVADIEKHIIESINKTSGEDCLKRMMTNNRTMDELEFHQLLCDNSPNEYLRNLFQNAIIYYVRFAIKCRVMHSEKISQIQSEVIMKPEGIGSTLRDYYHELAECVISERRKNQ